MLDPRLRSFVCLASLVAGCSVLNSFDDVGPVKEPGGGDSGSGGTTGGTESGGTSSGNAGEPSEAGQGGTGMTVPEGGSGGGGSSPVEGGGGAGGEPTMMGPPGLIVVSGTDTDSGNAAVLSVLSPQSGKELHRDKAVVPMFAHDGVRNMWYVATFANAMVGLRMRTFDRVANDWVNAAKELTVPAPADNSANGWVALRARFAYLTAGGNDLVVVDSTDPGALKIQTTLHLASKANGLIGSFGNNPGGTVNIVRTNTGCIVDDKCDVTLARVQVKAIGDLTEDTQVIVGTVPNPNGKATWGANTADGNDVLLTPNSTGGLAELVQLNTGTHSSIAGTNRIFSFNSTQPRGFAYDQCTGMAFTAELVAKTGNTSVYAIPEGVGTVGSVQPPQAAQGVFFEPYTHTLLTPFSSGGNYELLAYTVGGMPAAPKLNKRSGVLWSPPTDLNPALVAVASPFPAECE